MSAHKAHPHKDAERTHIACIDRHGDKHRLDIGLHTNLHSAWSDLRGLIGLISPKESVWIGTTKSDDGHEQTFGSHEALSLKATSIIEEIPKYEDFALKCQDLGLVAADASRGGRP